MKGDLFDFIVLKKSKEKATNRDVWTPSFVMNSKTEDVIAYGGKMRALYNPFTGMWETDKVIAAEIIDRVNYEHVAKLYDPAIMANPEYAPIVRKLVDTDNGLSRKFQIFFDRDMETKHIALNQKVMFSNSEFKKSDHVTFVLNYPILNQPTPAFDQITAPLYVQDEKTKFMWLIGAFIAGDQGKIQKFAVFYGDPGTGKSTILNIIKDLLGGEDSPYLAKCTAELLVDKNQFGTDFLEGDPIVAIDDEANLSIVNSRSTLNLIASHERVRVNPKYGKAYWVYPKCFLIFAANDPVQVSPKSGFVRRLIDIRPTGEKIPVEEYDALVERLKFERSGIAYKCLETYKRLGKNYYNNYIPEDMMSLSSPFHNFVKDHYPELSEGITLANAYTLYTAYCEESKLKNVLPKYRFRDNLKSYFTDYGDFEDGTGKVIRTWFSGFRKDRIGMSDPKEEVKEEPVKSIKTWLEFNCTESLFDKVFADQPAQYANEDGTPKNGWNYISTKLSEILTNKLHWVKLPEYVITMDFDLKDENGNKSFEKNLEAASKFPPTYAELSKSGAGIHLHYIWTGGDPKDLEKLYADNIEIKAFKGNEALRRKLTKCNDYPIAELSSGLPKREEKTKVIDWQGYKNERIIRTMIEKNLNKQYHKFTKPSIDYIYDILKSAYESGVVYDVSDRFKAVYGFALNSHNNKEYCVNLVNRMHFKSDHFEEANNETDDYKKRPIIFLDIETYPEGEDPEKEPSLFVVCWKYMGEGKSVVKMINPSPEDVKKLFYYRIIGFNNKDYDNHMLWAKAMGMSNAEVNRRSQGLIASKKSDKWKWQFREAKNLSYTDVLDFAAAHNKMSLKKWEIELQKMGKLERHMEMNIPWDKPAPKDRWNDIAEYCANDVIATEAVFNYIYPDFEAREMLATLTGMTVNDSTNNLTIAWLTKGIDNPQKDYIYTDLSTIYPGYEFDLKGIDPSRYKPGVKIVKGRSIYKGIDPGEGGRKIGYPGMYRYVGLFDVSSMHPSSMIKLKIFGEEITSRLEALVNARIAIKHKQYDEAIRLLGDEVRPYLTGDEETLKRNAKALAGALKTAINSVYGLTSASFDNKLRDPRNVDNIVAKYGALFMIDLEEELTNMGYTVVHVATDSIKVANIDNRASEYIMRRGKEMGFNFEFEAIFEKLTLVNDAVYIAKYLSTSECERLFNYIPDENAEFEREKSSMWTPTGKQFAVPYVFKTLFSHEDLTFDDFCETFNVNEGALYLDYNEGLPTASIPDKFSKDIWNALDKHNDAARAYAQASEEERPALKVKVDRYRDKLERLMREASDYLDQGYRHTEVGPLLADLKIASANCHNYKFVGRIGRFTPMVSGVGAGELVCIRSDRSGTSSPSGSKDYRWMESEAVRATRKEDYIDKSYYDKLVADAIKTISSYGDYDWFIQ